VLLSALAFYAGWLAMAVVTEPLRACMSALLTLYAFQPQQLAEMYPILHHRFSRISELRKYGREDDLL
jgi:hypothetical protein